MTVKWVKVFIFTSSCWVSVTSCVHFVPLPVLCLRCIHISCVSESAPWFPVFLSPSQALDLQAPISHHVWMIASAYLDTTLKSKIVKIHLCTLESIKKQKNSPLLQLVFLLWWGFGWYYLHQSGRWFRSQLEGEWEWFCKVLSDKEFFKEVFLCLLFNVDFFSCRPLGKYLGCTLIWAFELSMYCQYCLWKNYCSLKNMDMNHVKLPNAGAMPFLVFLLKNKQRIGST